MLLKFWVAIRILFNKDLVILSLTVLTVSDRNLKLTIQILLRINSKIELL
jgi:hypothetical protein